MAHDRDGIGKQISRSTRVGLISCETVYPPRGGPSVHIYQVWHRLQRMSYEVRAWGRQAVPGYREYPRTGAGLARLLDDVDLLYIRFPFDSDFGLANAARLLLRRKLPMVCEFNAPLYEFMRECPPRTLWSLRYKAKLYSRNHLLVRSCIDHAICVSTVMADYARDEFGVRDVTVLPNGGDPELFTPDLRSAGRVAMGVTDDDFVVFWGGSTAFDWQGLEQVMSAAERFADNRVRFVIAGDPAHLPRPLPSNVTVLGQLSYFDMPSFIAGADLCLCLYRDYDWCRIGFYNSPLKLFDYMACARPVVGSRMGQIAEVIRDGENGVLVDGDVQEIAEAITKLRDDPARREALGRSARESIVHHYNWQWVAEETATIIEGLLPTPKSRRAK